MERQEELLTLEEAAKILRVRENTLRIWLREGRTKGIKLGRFWRIRPEALEEFLKELEKSK